MIEERLRVLLIASESRHKMDVTVQEKRITFTLSLVDDIHESPVFHFSFSDIEWSAVSEFIEKALNVGKESPMKTVVTTDCPHCSKPQQIKMTEGGWALERDGLGSPKIIHICTECRVSFSLVGSVYVGGKRRQLIIDTEGR